MVNLGWQADRFDVNTYLAHDWGEVANLGFRAAYNFMNGSVGTAVVVWNFQEKEDRLIHYELDGEYTSTDLVKIVTQISNIDDGIDHNDDDDDMQTYLLANLEPGYTFPFVGKTRPYAGIATSNGIQEYNVVTGINFNPLEAAYVKVEYQTNKDKEEKLDLQVVYKF